MGKKPKTITINDSVREFGKMVQVGGAFTELQAKQYLSDYQFDEFKRLNMLKFSDVRVTKDQLFKLAENNIISQEELCSKMKDKVINVRIYSLSDKGRRFESKALGLEHAHYSNSKYHDVFLTAKFNELTPEERESAKPEGQVREELREKIDDMRKNEPEKLEEILNKYEEKLEGLTPEERESAKPEGQVREELREKIDDMRKNEPEKLEEILNKYEEKLEGFIEKFENEGGYGSPVDFSYTSSSSSQTMGYEIVTKDYKFFSICCKELTCDLLNYQYEDMRV